MKIEKEKLKYLEENLEAKLKNKPYLGQSKLIVGNSWLVDGGGGGRLSRIRGSGDEDVPLEVGFGEKGTFTVEEALHSERVCRGRPI